MHEYRAAAKPMSPEAGDRHRSLPLWQKAMALTRAVYEMTRLFPKHEMYGLTNQMRRAAVSIPSNIAEGAARRSTREYIAFLYVARGSMSELQTQLLLAHQLGYVEAETAETSIATLDEVARLLTAVIGSLNRRLVKSERQHRP